MTRPRRTQARQPGLAPRTSPRSGAAAGGPGGSPVSSPRSPGSSTGPVASSGRSPARSAGSGVPGPQPSLDAADEPFVPERWIRHLGWPVFGAVVGLAGLLLTGVPLWRSVVIALSGAIVLYLVVRSMAAEPPEWPYDVTLEPIRPYTAWEVAGLDGARERGTSFQRYLRPRLSDLSRELLRRRGIDPDSGRAVTLLGAEAHRLLTDESAPAPDSAALSRLCLAIARLAVEPIPGTTTPLRDPALRGLAGHPARRSGSTPRKDTNP